MRDGYTRHLASYTLLVSLSQTVSSAVTTMDLAGTFLDYAGVQPDRGMTTKSLRPLLTGSGGPQRAFVSSGLQSMPFTAEATTDR